MRYRDSPFPLAAAAFDVDGMLGGLAKWLRILGFDAVYPCRGPKPGRFFVTTVKAKMDAASLTVTSRDPVEQAAEVLVQAEITPDPELLLTRCLICNIPVIEISRSKAQGAVPDQVLAAAPSLNQCPSCSRIYWKGSHEERIIQRVKRAGIQTRCPSSALSDS